MPGTGKIFLYNIVQREDRCCALLWSAADSVQVAGVISEPDFADIPGSPHVLTFRLPRIKDGEPVFGALVRDGELIGVVYQTVYDAGFDGEGDLAYASPIDRLLDLFTTHRAVQVDWTTARPGGNWAPPANEIEIQRKLEPFAQLWLFSKQISDSGTPRFQLEAHWGRIRTPRSHDAAWVSTVSATALFPPNDCTEWFAAFAHEQSASHPIESASRTSSPLQTTAIDEWLERLPELTGGAVVRLEAAAGELLDGRLLFNPPPTIWTEGASLQAVESLRPDGIADIDCMGNALGVSSSTGIQVVGHDGQPLTPELKCDDREISCAAISADGSTVLGADYDHHLWVWRRVKPALKATVQAWSLVSARVAFSALTHMNPLK